MKSVTRLIEKDLKLIVNRDKSKVGSPNLLKFLSCLIKKVNRTCRFIPTKEAKKKLIAKLKRLTSRKQPGTIKTIIKEITQVTR